MKDKHTKNLTDEQKEVLLNKGTEAPFSGKYVDHKESGVYKCAACGTELFDSKNKFDSGSGWPSFDDVLDGGKVELVTDNSHGMKRTEVVCKNCGGHLGHMFEDGPVETTGKRYCINSCSLDFDNK